MICLKAAELFVKCLEQQEVKYIFGVPGEENIDFIDALQGSSIRFIVCRHETGAAFIAGIMGKLTGKPGVCLSTLGPGATNMMTGVACATLDRLPLIAITGQTDLNMQHKGSHQYLNLIGLYHPVTKWNTSIHEGTAIPETVARSFSLAVSDLPGAVHIELPNDVASYQVEEPPDKWLPVKPERDDEKVMVTDSAIDEVAMAINQASRPLVFIGNRAVDISSSVLPLIEKLQAPVTETYMAKGIIPGSHPLHLQTIGLPEGDFVNQAFNEADLVMTIGYDPIEYGAQKWNKGRVPIIHINDQEPEKNNRFYPMKASLVGDMDKNLQRLTANIQQKEEMQPIYQQLKETITSDLTFLTTSDSCPLVPQRIIQDIQEVLSPDDILVSDVGAHKLWIGRQYQAAKPNQCIISNGLASMGMGLPGAIGAKLACPDKKVLAICGDGAFIMSLAEFETAVRLQLPVVIMIWRDGRYAAIEWEQQNKLGRSSGVQFDNPDFMVLAKAYGAKGYKVEQASELPEILQKAFSENGPVLVECPVDYTENFRLSERLRAFRG